MPKLDKTYNITLDIKQTINNSIPQYYISDNDTSEIMITITDDKKPIQLDNVIVLMVAIAPDREKLYDFIDVRTSEEGLIYCNLKSQFKDLEGTWYARLMIISNEEKLVTDTFSYNVKTDDFIDMNDEVIDDDRYPLLSDIISRLSTIEITELSRQNIESIRVREEKIRVANENIRILNEQTRQTQHTTSLQSIDNKIVDIENRFRTMTASQQQDSEVIDARDGETSLHARLERDLAKGKIIEENSEGTYITVKESVVGNITDIEILGNTTQDPLNLADIQSVGTLEEDGRCKMSILSCGKNLLDISKVQDAYINTTTGEIVSNANNKAFGFIKVKSNTTFICSDNGTPRTMNIAEYDSSKRFIKFIAATTFTTSSNCSYVVVSVANTDYSKFKLEEGTVATTYEPYQYNKTSILLPCQLEKVGDVSDRLFRREDGVWCIEKNIDTLYINSSSANWSTKTLYEGNGKKYYGSPNNIFTGFKSDTVLALHKSFSDGGSARDHSDEAIVYTKKWGAIDFSVKAETLNDFKVWLDLQNYYLKYQLETPRIIELPLDIQIQLNSFNGTTNIFTEDTVIEPTIKATVPKSLAASIQSINEKTDNISQRVERVETLQKSSELEVSTDKSYVIVEDTNEGYINDVKFEGKTLVNIQKTPSGLYPDFNATNTLLQGSTSKSYYYSVEIGKTYTFIKSPSDRYLAGCCESIDVGSPIIKVDTTSNNSTMTMINKFIATGKYFFIYGSSTNTDFNTILLEGDHTQNSPSYFEGLKSVGDGVDKIEVLSSNNGNMISADMFVEGALTWVGGVFNATTGRYITNDFIEVVPNQILQRTQPCILFLYDKNKTYLGNESVGNKSASSTYSVDYLVENDVAYIKVQIHSESNKTMYLGFNQTLNKPYEGNKKQILYQTKEGNYEKPILRSTGEVSDTIEKHSDGKYYYHRRCGEGLINGTEYWMIGVSSQFTDTHMYFATNHFDTKMQAGICLANTLPQGRTWNKESIEGIDGANTSDILRVRIAKSKLTQQNDVGFKEWLTKNPTTFIYPLKVEEVYECVNLDLDSFEGETSVIFDGGAISPKITFKIASHIANTIQVLKDRINYLEDKVMGMFKSVLAGDVQTLAYELYPEDFKEEVVEKIETVEGTELL